MLTQPPSQTKWDVRSQLLGFPLAMVVGIGLCQPPRAYVAIMYWLDYKK